MTFPSKLNSIFVKLTLVLVLAVGAVAATLTYQMQQSKRLLTDSMIVDRAASEAMLVAKQAGGPLKFDKPGPLVGLFDEIVEAADGAAVGAAAYSGTGEHAASSTGFAPEAAGLSALARTALAEGETVLSESGHAIAAPVRHGAEDAVVGAVAMLWTPQPMLAELHKRAWRELVVGAVVFLLGAGAAIAIVGWTVVKPLGRLRRTIEVMGEGDYAVEVPGTGRGDEIGEIGRKLDALRQDLEAGAEMQKEAAFKGAGFMNSSAALMLIDEDLVIRYVNPRLEALMAEHAGAMPGPAARRDHRNLVGRGLDAFHPGDTEIPARLATLDGTMVETVAFGGTRIRLSISPVRSKDRRRLGFLLEWEDVTQQALNRGVIAAIEANQVKADFDTEGHLIDANPRFSDILGRTAGSDATLAGVVVAGPDGEDGETPSGPELIRVLGSAGVYTGKVRIATADGRSRLLDGSINRVCDDAGKPLRLLLMARDVTEVTERLAASRDATAESERQQARVVEALGVGLRRISDGDLTVRIEEPFDGPYEALRGDFNDAIQRLAEAMLEVLENAENITNEARDISTTADGLSRRTESTAATLEQSAAALDDLTRSVRAAAEMADTADKAVTEAKTNAEGSGEVVVETVQAMDEIAASSERITSIIKVIDDIAFQTNLLALNAGVEAARAGDAGRGFAVVASEVRALAQRSSEAAREINDLIAKSGLQVKRGVDLVGRTGDALREIVEVVSGIAGQMSEIAGSAKQQSSGLAEINSAVTQLDQSTQQNAARLEEATAASEALTKDAVALVETVGHFRIDRGAPAEQVVKLRPRAAVPADPAPRPAEPTPRPAGTDPARPRGSAVAAAAEPLVAEEAWEDF